jgi:hypothetical protein
MQVTEPTTAPSANPDLAHIERTLRISIKLMKRGQREMQRLRQKGCEHAQSDYQGAATANGN